MSPDQRERREAGNVYSTSAEIGTCHVYMSMCEYMSMMTPNDATSDTPRPVRRHLATGRRGALLRLLAPSPRSTSRTQTTDAVTRAGRCGGNRNDAAGTEGSQSQKVGWLGGSTLHMGGPKLGWLGGGPTVAVHCARQGCWQPLV